MAVKGCRPSDWPSVMSLCAQHAQLVPSFGVHPWDVEDLADSWLEDLKSAIESTPGAMLGECGLDRCTRGKQVDWETQKSAFRRQLGLAKELGKTVSIHCVRAPAELESALAEAGLTHPIILHSWVGSADSTAALLKRFPSVLISLSGHLFQKPPAKAMDMVSVVPADRLLVESDAPDG
ncbi:TatD related Dnase, partial [Helicosporidium sp. ATCC 50920]